MRLVEENRRTQRDHNLQTQGKYGNKDLDQDGAVSETVLLYLGAALLLCYFLEDNSCVMKYTHSAV